MPYEWQPGPARDQHLHLWPHRSLDQRGFVLFIGATSALIILPALAVLGSPVMWALLPFPLAAVAAVWFALRRNAMDREVIEDLHLMDDRISLRRSGPRGRLQTWEANPHWVRLKLHRKEGPVPNYLTLQGGPREVELGAFLSEEERETLHDDLQGRLALLRLPAGTGRPEHET